MKKLTKIIATIGPVSDSEEKIEELINAGVNVFRLNFKHGTQEWHGTRYERISKVAKKLGVYVGTLIDLQGPEIRIEMSKDSIDIKSGELLLFGNEALNSDEKGFSITHPQIIEHLKDGQKILADDGYYSFEVVKKDNKTYLKSKTTGNLPTRKSMNIPGAEFPFPVLTARDIDGIELATKHGIDFIALSMVRSGNDIKEVRKVAKKHGYKGKLIAKIETQKALDDITNIIDASDGIMVARGDLGVEIPIEQVPFYQKMMIKNCIIQGKFVITATQMLQSMIKEPFPTRAEVSDIANAVYDMTDCIMLSGETASGSYPLESVQVMAKTAMFYEPKTVSLKRPEIKFSPNDKTSMICHAAFNIYEDYMKAGKNIAGFVVFTQTGNSAKKLSRYHPLSPIYALTPNAEVCESLSVQFGISPYIFDFPNSNEVEIQDIKKGLMLLKKVNKGISSSGNLIVLHGDKWSVGSGLSTIRII